MKDADEEEEEEKRRCRRLKQSRQRYCSAPSVNGVRWSDGAEEEAAIGLPAPPIANEDDMLLDDCGKTTHGAAD